MTIITRLVLVTEPSQKPRTPRWPHSTWSSSVSFSWNQRKEKTTSAHCLNHLCVKSISSSAHVWSRQKTQRKLKINARVATSRKAMQSDATQGYSRARFGKRPGFTKSMYFAKARAFLLESDCEQNTKSLSTMEVETKSRSKIQLTAPTTKGQIIVKLKCILQNS